MQQRASFSRRDAGNKAAGNCIQRSQHTIPDTPQSRNIATGNPDERQTPLGELSWLCGGVGNHGSLKLLLEETIHPTAFCCENCAYMHPILRGQSIVVQVQVLPLLGHDAHAL